MTTLTSNLEFLGKINKKLVEKLQKYQEYDSQGSSTSSNIIAYDIDSQKNELVYLTCGNYSISTTSHGLNDSSEHHSLFRDTFAAGEITRETYSKCYSDIHEDLHIGFFIDFLKQKASENKSLKFTKRPNRRTKPTFLVLNGLAGRQDLLELILDVQPKHIFAVENEIELVYDFLSQYSIEEIRDYCNSLGKISFSLSIGCGAPEDHINELKAWIAHNNELATEGLLISNTPTPSIKKEAMRKFITTDTWHVDTINNMGYQVDEYNMIANTSANFNSLSNRIFLSNFCTNDSFSNIPIVITGSGPSLDASIPYLTEHRKDFILVSGGSSISTLLKSGLKPDIHVQLERSEHQFDLHSELSKSYDLSDIFLIASSTVPQRHQKLFNKIVYFFRPALSPLALYASNNGEILNAEGPDTINAAVASISSLGFKRIALFGVDCGSSSKSSIRSKGAFGGYIPRKLTKVERGARGSSIFTNPRLQTVRNAIGWSLKLNKVKASNFSDGLNIPNTAVLSPKDFHDWVSSSSLVSPQQSSDMLTQLWDHSLELNEYRLNTSWEIADPRQKVFDFCRNFEHNLDKTDDIREIVSFIRQMVSISKRRHTKSHQLIPRIVRGTLGKMCPIILSFYNCTYSEHPEEDVLPFLKEVLLEFIDLMESDLYSVIDYIEPLA